MLSVGDDKSMRLFVKLIQPPFDAAVYLIVLVLILLGLQFTMGDSLIFPIVTYVLVSSFIVLACATSSRCCSARRTIHKPLPMCISLNQANASPWLNIETKQSNLTVQVVFNGSFHSCRSIKYVTQTCHYPINRIISAT